MIHALVLTLTLMTSALQAETLRGKIHSFVPGNDGESNLIKLESGRVVFMNAADKSLNSLELSNQNVEITTDDENNLISIKTLNVPKTFEEIIPLEVDPNVSFEPTVIKGYANAEKIFNRLNSNYQRVSQCFNRAHVWSRDEFENHGIKTMKTFVFFTNSYINRYRFNWWFHVAPMIKVEEEGDTVERVLDFRYTQTPVTVREWTEMFVYSKRSCAQMTKYSDFKNTSESEDCYVINVPMYYWQPYHIEEIETENRYQSQFNQYDVSAAFSEAFN